MSCTYDPATERYTECDGRRCLCPDRHSSSDSHTVLVAEVSRLRGALMTTLDNLNSLSAAHPGVRVYDKWREMVARALGNVDGSIRDVQP